MGGNAVILLHKLLEILPLKIFQAIFRNIFSHKYVETSTLKAKKYIQTLFTTKSKIKGILILFNRQIIAAKCKS